MKHLLSALALAGAATLFAPSAFACDVCDGTPLTGAFAVSIWNAATPNSTITSANQQALPTNPIITPGNLVSTGIYTGAIDFNYDPSHGTPTIGGFLATANGSYAGNGSTSAVISSGNFAQTTIMEFSFTTTKTLTNIDISHDDGVSLFAASAPGTNLLASSAASPTTDADATLMTLAAGTYHLWYGESNGVPAVLCFDPAGGGTAILPTATPEPASLALLGMGLATIGMVRRRRAA